MSNALQKFVQAEQSGLKAIVGSFTLNAGAPTINTKQNRRGLWDVTKTGTGTYTVTLTNPYYFKTGDVGPQIEAFAQSGSATVMAAAFVQAGLWNSTTKSFPIFTGSTNGTAADLSIAAALTIGFTFVCIDQVTG